MGYNGFFTLDKNKRIGPEGGNQEGLWSLHLDGWLKQPEPSAPGGILYKHHGSLIVNSGNRFNQHFRTKQDQHVGELEPVPEGVFTLSDLAFASGKWGDYSKIFPGINSPISVIIDPDRAIEFHLDANRIYAPGSAGCVVFRTMADLMTFVSWYEGNAVRFKSLHVNWGLGTVTFPGDIAAQLHKLRAA